MKIKNIYISTVKIIFIFIIMLFVGIFSIIGMSGRNIEKIAISGDAEVAKIVKKLAYVYSKKTGVVVDVNSTGSLMGLQDLKDGISDLALMSRKAQGQEGAHIKISDSYIAREGIVIITNREIDLQKTIRLLPKW